MKIGVKSEHWLLTPGTPTRDAPTVEAGALADWLAALGEGASAAALQVPWILRVPCERPPLDGNVDVHTLSSSLLGGHRRQAT
jgi:hypothetical protein